ncbi:MAG TPA: hypothetical protein VER26_18390 [Xanthobacteraceae bacterium]|nr:hypothetical protein [Xanthobacteraceae bacterium]
MFETPVDYFHPGALREKVQIVTCQRNAAPYDFFQCFTGIGGFENLTAWRGFLEFAYEVDVANFIVIPLVVGGLTRTPKSEEGTAGGGIAPGRIRDFGHGHIRQLVGAKQLSGRGFSGPGTTLPCIVGLGRNTHYTVTVRVGQDAVNIIDPLVRGTTGMIGIVQQEVAGSARNRRSLDGLARLEQQHKSAGRHAG